MNPWISITCELKIDCMKKKNFIPLKEYLAKPKIIKKKRVRGTLGRYENFALDYLTKNFKQVFKLKNLFTDFFAYDSEDNAWLIELKEYLNEKTVWQSVTELLSAKTTIDVDNPKLLILTKKTYFRRPYMERLLDLHKIKVVQVKR